MFPESQINSPVGFLWEPWDPSNLQKVPNLMSDCGCNLPSGQRLPLSLIPLLQAGVGSPTEEAPFARNLSNQDPRRGQGAKDRTVATTPCSHVSALHIPSEAPAPEAQARSSAQVSKCSLIHNQLQDSSSLYPASPVKTGS